jgi:hypothetical protein
VDRAAFGSVEREGDLLDLAAGASRDRGSLFEESTSDLDTDAAAGSGDDRDPAVE